jgi:hypothetical protein
MLIATLRVDPEGAGPPAKNVGIRAEEAGQPHEGRYKRRGDATCRLATQSIARPGPRSLAAEETRSPSANEERWHAHPQRHNGGNGAERAFFSPSRS